MKSRAVVHGVDLLERVLIENVNLHAELPQRVGDGVAVFPLSDEQHVVRMLEGWAGDFQVCGVGGRLGCGIVVRCHGAAQQVDAGLDGRGPLDGAHLKTGIGGEVGMDLLLPQNVSLEIVYLAIESYVLRGRVVIDCPDGNGYGRAAGDGLESLLKCEAEG